MPEGTSGSLSARLRDLTSELRSIDEGLRADDSVSGPVLREFRQALDNARLTAWTVSELENARQIERNARAVTSFLTAERLRRFRQIVADLCTDLEHDAVNWPAQSIDDLQESAKELRERLSMLSYSRKNAGTQAK